MQKLDGKDFELIEAAQKAIAANYDGVHFNHTVGAAVRCGSGKIYTGVTCIQGPGQGAAAFRL